MLVLDQPDLAPDTATHQCQPLHSARMPAENGAESVNAHRIPCVNMMNSPSQLLAACGCCGNRCVGVSGYVVVVGGLSLCFSLFVSLSLFLSVSLSVSV